MFEKYTEEARRTIFFARYQVSQLGGQAIEPEHLLLGLLREDKFVVPRLLGEREEAGKEAIRQRIEEYRRAGEKVSTSVEIPLSEEARDVLSYAAEESERMAHKHIGTEHLLLGLLRVEEGFSSRVLSEHGIGYKAVREAVNQMYDV